MKQFNEENILSSKTDQKSGIGSSLPTYKELFDNYAELEADRAKKIKRGINDFSPLEAVLSVNDEVRLHTRFLYRMLNPAGSHYRGNTFLTLFLKTIGREGWLNVNSDSLKIKKEYCPSGNSEQIDLYITDGKRTIIIENKLNALDQPGQVKRYLKAVGANSGEKLDSTLFIYLTKGRSSPSNDALAYPENKSMGIPPDPTPLQVFSWQGMQALGVKRNGGEELWAWYQNLNYRHHFTGHRSVHSWLDACEQSLEGLKEATNIVYAIQDYRNIVKRATKEYSSKVKSLKEHFEMTGGAGGGYHAKAIEMAKELNQAHEQWLHEAMTDKLNNLLHSKTQNGSLVRIGSENLAQLRPFVNPSLTTKLADLIYNQKTNFFRDDGKLNRGSFYIVKMGPYKDQVILMLFYGKTDIHVGLIGKEDAKIDTKTMESEFSLTPPTKLRNRFFPGALSWSQRLKGAGILSLADFDKSAQADIMKKISERFSPITKEDENS